MLYSESNISFKNKAQVASVFKTHLKEFKEENQLISQENLLHKIEINLEETSANIKVSFSKKFYLVYFSVIIFFLILPKQSPFIWSSSLAAFVIFSTVMYFSLEYKMKTILDWF